MQHCTRNLQILYLCHYGYGVCGYRYSVTQSHSRCDLCYTLFVILLQEIVEWFGNLREVSDKLSVEISKSQEPSNLFDCCRDRPFFYSFEFSWIHGNFSFFNYHAGKARVVLSKSQAQGNSVGLVLEALHLYGIYLQGHVTKRSRPTIPSTPLSLTTSSSSEQEKLTNRKIKIKI